MNVVETICEAWRSKNLQLLNDVLADTFVWYEGPFEAPVTTKKQLLEMWKNDLSPQEDIKVTSEILAETSEQVIAHWAASYAQAGSTYTLDGIFQIQLEDGKLAEFRQWWVKK